MPLRHIQLPLDEESIRTLRIGEEVALHGIAYTARDAAHNKMRALLEAGQPLPFSLQGACIYYAGPCPAAPGEAIGPCGPTTSGRMDVYTPALLELGLSAMIGKGKRTQEVQQAMRGRAVYFAATGGAAVFIARSIISSETIAFPELGAEAVRRIALDGLPAVVAVDAAGGDIYATVRP